MNQIQTVSKPTQRYHDLNLESRFLITSQLREILKDRNGEFYRIIWNRGSTIEIKVDQIPIPLKSNQILCLTPHQQFKIQDKDQANELISLIFNREFYCIHQNDHEVSCEGLLFYGTSEISIIELNESENEKFDTLIRVLRDEIQTRDSIQGEMLRMLLKRFIIKCTRLAKDQNLGKSISHNQVDLIRNFNVLVEKHYRDKKSVSEYAEMLYKSPKTLSNLFSKTTDKTPLQVIHNRIIVEAKRLMLYTDKATKEIAYDLGYDNVPNFSRLFKKETGITPTEFREQSITNGEV